jgi:hypothetical protein
MIDSSFPKIYLRHAPGRSPISISRIWPAKLKCSHQTKTQQAPWPAALQCSPKTLPDIVAEILQVIPDRNHELVSIRAIDDAMVVAQHQPQDDRRTELRAVNTRVGDGDGAARHGMGLELLAACAPAQIGDGPLQADKAQVLHASLQRSSAHAD